MLDRPPALKTLKGEDASWTSWSDIRVGMIVYIYATHNQKEYAAGPFIVTDSASREMRRKDSFRTFIHWPEEIYRLKG